MDNAQHQSQLSARFGKQSEQSNGIGSAGDGRADLDAWTEPSGGLQGSDEMASEFFEKVSALHKPTSFGLHHRTKRERRNPARSFAKKEAARRPPRSSLR